MEPSTEYKSNKNIGAKQELIKVNNDFPPAKLQRAPTSMQQSGADANKDSKIVAKYGFFGRGSISELDQLRSLLYHSTGCPRQLMQVVENLMEKVSIVKGRFLDSVAEFRTELHQFSCNLVMKAEERNTTIPHEPKNGDGLKMSKSPFFVCVSAKNIFKEKPTLYDYICMAAEIYNIQSNLQLVINKITQNQNTIKKEPPSLNESLDIRPVKNRRVAVQTDDVFDDLNKKEINKCDKAVSVINICNEQKLCRSLTCYINYIPPVEIINSSNEPKQNEEIIGCLKPKEYPKQTENSLNFFEKYSSGEQMGYNLSRSHRMLGENSNEQLYSMSIESQKESDLTNKRKDIKRKICAVRLMNDYLKVRSKEDSKIPLQSQPSSSHKVACNTSKCNCLQAVYEVLKGCQSRNASTVTIEDTSKRYNLNEIIKRSHKSTGEMKNGHRKHHKIKRERNSLEKNQIVSTTEKKPGRCDGLMKIEK